MGRFWVYILRCADGSLYTGATTDVKRRLAEHNTGKGARYTRSRRPVALAYFEEAGTLKAALRREHEIKKLSRRAKLLLCASGSEKPAPSSR